MRSDLRSALTNGRLLPRDIDGRSSEARRFRDLVQAITELKGGSDNLGQHALNLIKRYASLTVRLEALDEQQFAGGSSDSDLYVRLCGQLSRTSSLLGLNAKVDDDGDAFNDFDVDHELERMRARK